MTERRESYMIGEKVIATYSYSLRGTTYSIEGEVVSSDPLGRWVRIQGEVNVRHANYSFTYWGEQEQYGVKWVSKK